jgi:hypothetical protein
LGNKIFTFSLWAFAIDYTKAVKNIASANSKQFFTKINFYFCFKTFFILKAILPEEKLCELCFLFVLPFFNTLKFENFQNRNDPMPFPRTERLATFNNYY